MSLINEALKKAQGQRQSQEGTTPPGGPVPPHEPHHPPAQKPHRRSFLWGFLMAVLIVGAFSILLTTFFVRQILNDSENNKTDQPSESAITEPEAAKASGSSSSVTGIEKTEKSPGKQENASKEAVPAETDLPAKEETGPVPEGVTASEDEPRAIPETGSPARTIPPQPPNPAVVARMLEIEIRGVLGGSKVLILDQATGRTKAHRVGDPLEGSMGLIVEEITGSHIKFKDYAGYIHSKSF